MGNVKVWNGSSFVEAKSVKVWNGSSWVNRLLKHWNGSSWVDDSTKVYTFDANMSDSVSEAWAGWRTTNDYPYQSAWTDNENNVGFVWFNPTDLAKLAGKTISKVEVYFYRKDGYGYSAARGLHVWGTTWASSKRGDSVTFAQAVASLANETADAVSLAWNAGGWGEISNSVGEKMRDGTMHGIGLYVASEANNEYMACNAYNEANNPQIRITCY